MHQSNRVDRTAALNVNRLVGALTAAGVEPPPDLAAALITETFAATSLDSARQAHRSASPAALAVALEREILEGALVGRLPADFGTRLAAAETAQRIKGLEVLILTNAHDQAAVDAVAAVDADALIVGALRPVFDAILVDVRALVPELPADPDDAEGVLRLPPKGQAARQRLRGTGGQAARRLGGPHGRPGDHRRSVGGHRRHVRDAA